MNTFFGILAIVGAIVVAFFSVVVLVCMIAAWK